MAENEEIEELKKELSKLNPEAKIKRLKELEEKRKSEISKIEELIKDSEKEIKAEKVAEEIRPKQASIDIQKLFEEEAGQLERTVKSNIRGRANATGDYASLKQAYSDYSKLSDIAYASMMGQLSSAQLEAIDVIGERLDRSKYKPVSQEVANVLVASRAALYKIKKYAGLE